MRWMIADCNAGRLPGAVRTHIWGGMKIPFLNRAPRVSVLRLQGAIGISGRGGAGLNDAALAPLLERAFTKGKPKAVALAINSPGGSPVQSSLIAARIRRLADKHEVPVHAFVEDVAASGGYWLASAADQIWADQCSVVGSIGVISGGFGLQDFISRHNLPAASSVSLALKTLINREFIYKYNGSYIIYDRFFGMWLRKNCAGN